MEFCDQWYKIQLMLNSTDVQCCAPLEVPEVKTKIKMPVNDLGKEMAHTPSKFAVNSTLVAEW